MYLWHSQTLNGRKPWLFFLIFPGISFTHGISQRAKWACAYWESIKTKMRAIERWHWWTSDLPLNSLAIALQAYLSRLEVDSSKHFRLAQVLQMDTALISSLCRMKSGVLVMQGYSEMSGCGQQGAMKKGKTTTVSLFLSCLFPLYVSIKVIGLDWGNAFYTVSHE